MTRANEPEALELPGLVRDLVREGARKAQVTKARKAAEAAIAEDLPIARVLLDLPGAHLDRTFDYAVPASMAAEALPGVRVKAKFGSNDTDGYLLERRAETDHVGTLTPLRRIVGAERVLLPSVARAAEAVAGHYAGTRTDLLRLAIPPRHAATERLASRPDSVVPLTAEGSQVARVAWAGHEPSEAFLHHLSTGGTPRAVWHAAPGSDWAEMVAYAVWAARASGRGAIVCVPEHKELAHLDAALTRVLGEGQHVQLSADQGPAARYQAFLSVARGAVHVAIGTRGAIWAPVHNLGLIVVWDEGDELLAEPRMPYPHAREVARARAEIEPAALLVGAFAPSGEARTWVATGWAREISPDRGFARARLLVSVPGASDVALERDPLARASRVPKEAHDLIRRAVALGPVLVQVPRKGYAAALACDTCRTPARCEACTGPLHQAGPTAPPTCRWCGLAVEVWQCSTCGGRGLRAPILGEARTAEELGRAFAGVRVVSSSGERIIAQVGSAPAIVVATPGAEPRAEGGYAAVVILDTWLALGWPGLRADEDVLRKYSNALALAAPGGRGLVVGEPTHPVIQALVRWDQPGFIDRELVERAAAHLPPAARIATITGEGGALSDALTVLVLPEHAEVLGPVPEGDQWRAVLRVPASAGLALAESLAELNRVRGARRLDPVRIQLDPPTL